MTPDPYTEFLSPTPRRTPMADDSTALLLEITANLDAYIEKKATAIAQVRITAVEDEAEQKVIELMAGHAAEVERYEDLIRELRRQMKPLVRHVEHDCPLVKERRARMEAARRGGSDA